MKNYKILLSSKILSDGRLIYRPNLFFLPRHKRLSIDVINKPILLMKDSSEELWSLFDPYKKK
uniref:Ribosomal protein L31 n=1 Tax=Ishige okamurae TaxID=233772 RepID=A0A4Y5T950_9PHAE|nr:ribosomal protein L31 [Ishige okamurae]